MDETYHVFPINDTAEHEESLHCACSPQIEFIATSKGDRWIIIHRPLDNPEQDDQRSTHNQRED